ncbi:glycosyltransferase [Occultella glacieicola]|uniref:Glycosyltransferase n=2 Tax=Occultella glacieicola TaxID=2518684 RepID=A0ABY2E5E4_9MICO|nr:glycosyltransferase [Occultella glacieicola]
MVVIAGAYGAAAFTLFSATGIWGRWGENGWRDAALLLVTITAACALTYISMLVMAYLRRSRNPTGDPGQLEWHLMIPCRDEESVIAATVSAARTSFPLAHVWVIDDDSEDATASIVAALMEFDPRVHLISRVRPDARIGKGEALNAAYRTIGASLDAGTDRAQVIIGVLDADGYLSDNTLAHVAGPEAFGDPKVGAVQVEVWMKNRNDRRPLPNRGRLANAVGRLLVRMQDVEFRTTNSAMQLLRVAAGSVGMGGNGQFTRLSVLDELTVANGRPWGRKLCEDFELGLGVLTLGHRTHYVREAHVSQEALPYLRRLLTQRTRWAQGVLECASLLPALRRSGMVRLTGQLEIHYFMLLPWIMMVNLLVLPTLTFLAVVEGRFDFLSESSLAFAVTALLVFLILPYASWGPIYRRVTTERIGVLAGIGLGLATLVYAYLTYLYYPRAIARLVTGRNAWAKTKRNADDVVPLSAPALPVLDSLALLRREQIEDLAGELDQRNDLALEFVSGFAIMWPTRLARLNETVAAAEQRAARDAAVSLAASAAMLGADRLEAVARAVDAVVANGRFDEARRLLTRVDEVGEQTVDVLRTQVLADIRGE